ncbi:UNVERIFIED_CONTAM: hypothetical protein RMT77_019476 [Armadillidium vulgare]
MMESHSEAPSFKQTKKKSKKKLKLESVINPSYLGDDFQEEFYNCWRNDGQQIKQDLSKEKDLRVLNDPFNCAFIPNILQDLNLLHEVSSELEDISLQIKNNDLFKFKCSTNDLKVITKPSVQKLCKYIEGPLKKWVEKLSGLSLNGKVSISCSKYDYSDVLLCHDDELEGRRIAFVLYLVSDWKKSYGGSLDLFTVDEYNRPYCIAERLYPKFNSFSVFEVSPVSFHQVSEVITKDQTRLSVNGWFYGTPIVYPPRPFLKSPVFILPGEIEESVLYTWISPLYLDQTTQAQVRSEFQEKSEIQLSDFLKKKKYDLLAEALSKEDLRWRWVGPPNKRLLEVVSKKDIPDIVSEYLTLMQSDAMFLILSQLTGLELHHLAPKEEEEEDETSEESSNEGDEKKFEFKDNETPSRKDKGCSTKKRKNKSIQNDRKKRKLECRSKGGNKPYCGVGGLLDDGWESNIDSDFVSKLRQDQTELESKAEVSSEIRRWRWGAYSLMIDDDLRSNKDFVLDAIMYFTGSNDWTAEFGGGTVYVAEGDDEELLTVLPVPNSLALVYRDNKTFRFTKHVNVKSRDLGTNSAFHEISCMYRENFKNL